MQKTDLEWSLNVIADGLTTVRKELESITGLVRILVFELRGDGEDEGN